jgi:hypothetical protein
MRGPCSTVVTYLVALDMIILDLYFHPYCRRVSLVADNIVFQMRAVPRLRIFTSSRVGIPVREGILLGRW